MSEPSTLKKIKKTVEAMGFITETISAGVTWSLIAHHPNIKVAFQAYWTKGPNMDTPGSGWAGASIIDPIGIPRELYFDYSPKALGSKKPTPDQIQRGRDLNAEYNTGEDWRNTRPYISNSREFFQWIDDWQLLILKEGNFTPLYTPPKPKPTLLEAGEWTG